MNKMQALNKFWTEATGLTAYEENSIPDDAQLPYCTYQTLIDSLDAPVFPMGHVWMRTDSWKPLDTIQMRVERYIEGGRILPMDEGKLFVCKGRPFSQRETDESNNSIKGYLINIQIEYLSK